MDTGPIVNMFTQLITVGTAVALIVCAFFVMMAGYQYMTAVAACARSSLRRAASTTPSSAWPS